MRRNGKIMLYIDSMHRGGAERVMSVLANYFSERGCEVILVTDLQMVAGDYPISDKVKYVCIEPSTNNFLLKNWDRMRRLRSLVKKEKVDTVLSFLGKQNYRILIATIGLKCRKCVSVRNDPNKEYGKSWYKKWLADRIIGLADVCVFQTEDAKKYFGKKIQKNSMVIPNPIDKKFFDVKIVKNPENIITVGRLETQKNHRLLIDAFVMVADKVGENNLLIYGDGSLRDELQEYIEKIGMGKRIILKGEVDHIENELAKARLFVLSSDYEGMPNALMEAMAVGVPCVSTDCPCGGPKELFGPYGKEWLVPCGDPKSLSRTIVKAIDSDSGGFLCKDMDTYKSDNILQSWFSCVDC